MPKNTGRGSRGAREAAAASHGHIPDGAFTMRGTPMSTTADPILRVGEKAFARFRDTPFFSRHLHSR